MVQSTRRSWIKNNIAIAAAATAASSMPKKTHATRVGTIILSHRMGLNSNPNAFPDRQKLSLQMGVRHAISAAPFSRISRDQYVAAAQKNKNDWAEAGFTVSAYETMFPVPSQNIKMGTPGRDEELRNFIAALEAMGKVGIPVLCYNFGSGGQRTSAVVARGGAIANEFDYEESKKQPTVKQVITEEQLWDNLTWLIERIIPVAEKSNVKMGMHPTDPPISPYLGSGQIMKSAADYRRLFAIADSPCNGATFCQANFRAMGEDIYSVAREFAERGKIHFIHYRDIEGTAATKFTETFHDNGPTDMPRMLQIYSRSGFNGPLRTDHAPAMLGEDSSNTSATMYGMTGHIFALGYTKGMMDALNIPYV